MPSQNFLSQAQDGALIANMEAVILEYAARILSTEAPFQNPTSPQTYNAYNKRMALASEVIATKGKIHAKRAAILVADMKPDLVQNYENDFSSLFNNNVCEGKIVYNNGYGTASNTDGNQMWNILAGVNQYDLL